MTAVIAAEYGIYASVVGTPTSQQILFLRKSGIFQQSWQIRELPMPSTPQNEERLKLAFAAYELGAQALKTANNFPVGSAGKGYAVVAALKAIKAALSDYQAAMTTLNAPPDS